MAPNPNISGAIAPADITTMKANVAANKAFLDPFGVNLTPEQRQEIPKTGADSVSYVTDGLSTVTNHPEVLPGDMDATEYGKDVALFTALNDLFIHHGPYYEMLKDTLIAVGSECILQTNRVYRSAKDQAKNNNALQIVVEQLGRRYEKLRGPRKKFAQQKVLLTPGSTVSLIDVAENSPIINDGAADLMVCDGALTICENGTLLTQGSRGIANAPTITVTNKSTTVNGSFTVKVEVSTL